MKKIPFLILFVALFSCSPEDDKVIVNDSSSQITNDFESTIFQQKNMSWNRVKSSTNKVSSIFYAMGVSKIDVTSSNTGVLEYRFQTYKLAGDKSFAYRDKIFLVKDSIIYEQNTPNYALKVVGNDIYLRTSSTNPFLLISDRSKFDANLLNEPNFILYSTFLNELMTDEEEKLTEQEHYDEVVTASGGTGGRSCHPDRIVTITASGSTQASANASLSYTERHGSWLVEPVGELCVQLGGVENTSILGMYYTSRSTWCCGGGASGSW